MTTTKTGTHDPQIAASNVASNAKTAAATQHTAPAPAPLPKTTVMPTETVTGRKIVQVALDTDSNTLLAVCDDGTLWQYPMAGIVPASSRLWTEMPIILTDAQLQEQAKAAEAPPPPPPPTEAPATAATH